MVDADETTESAGADDGRAEVTPLDDRRAAKATVKKAPAKKAPARKAPAKKAPAKKAPAKKAPAKAPAKKAPAKKAPAKAPAKKAPAKKAPARKAPAKKAPAKKAPAAKTPANAPAVTAPVSEVPQPASAVSGAARPRPAPGADAISLSISQDLLNDVALITLAEGMPFQPLDTTVVLPGMGEVGIRVELTLTGARLDLRAEDRGLARVAVSATGRVEVETIAEAGVVQRSTTPVAPPAPVPVLVEALVRPMLEIDEDGHLRVGVSMADAQMLSLGVDRDAPVPDGIDPAAWVGMLSMFGTMFDELGASLFETLAERLGSTAADLGSGFGSMLRELGVATGHADISVASGVLTVTLHGQDIVGVAPSVPVPSRAVGLGLADSVVDHLARMLLARAAGDLPVPLDLEIDLGDQQVSGRLRQPRILPKGFPDLRGTLHTEVRPRLVGGRLEVAVQSAWVEFPSIVPSLVNRVSRRLGDLVSLTPARVRFPATISVPLVPGSDDGLPIKVDSLQVTRDGLGVVLEMA